MHLAPLRIGNTASPIKIALLYPSVEKKLSAIFLDKQKPNSENLYAVINQGNDVTCSFSGNSKGSDETGPGKLTGTLYVSKGSAHLDLTLIPDNGTSSIQTSHLQLGNDGYLWSGTTGMKVKLDESNNSLFQSKYFSSEIVSTLNQSTDFSCNQWIPRPEVFTVPTTVNFNFLGNEANKLFDKMRGELNKFCDECSGLANDALIENCLKLRGCTK